MDLRDDCAAPDEKSPVADRVRGGLSRVALPRALDGDAATRELYRGFGDTLARAFELVMVPFIFGFGGWILDRWLGTSPVFVIVLGVLAVVGLSARMWYGYDEAMRAHEAALPGSRRDGSGPAGSGC